MNSKERSPCSAISQKGGRREIEIKKLMSVLGMIVVLAMLLSAVNCAGRAGPPGAATYYHRRL